MARMGRAGGHIRRLRAGAEASSNHRTGSAPTVPSRELKDKARGVMNQKLKRRLLTWLLIPGGITWILWVIYGDKWGPEEVLGNSMAISLALNLLLYLGPPLRKAWSSVGSTLRAKRPNASRFVPGFETVRRKDTMEKVCRIASLIFGWLGLIGMALYIHGTFNSLYPLENVFDPFEHMMEQRGTPNVADFITVEFAKDFGTIITWYYSPLNIHYWAVAMLVFSPALGTYLIARYLAWSQKHNN